MKVSSLGYPQMKPYFSDKVNNLAFYLFPHLPGNRRYPEILTYWNFYHTDELETTSWIFYTYFENLAFFGGVLDIFLLVPSFIMFGYTFRLNEINVFYYQ